MIEAAQLEQAKANILMNPRYCEQLVRIGGVENEMIIDTQFPPEDPWGGFLRRTLSHEAAKDTFYGVDIHEYGIGAAGNVIGAGHFINSITGVDIDPTLIEVADYNLSKLRPTIPHTLHVGSAPEFILTQSDLDGVAIMCLPQAKGSGSLTDVYTANYNSDLHRFDEYGLGLNAATLRALHAASTEDMTAYVIFSGRIPEFIIYDMFNHLGWDEQEKFETIVQQDPDTNNAWMEPFAKQTTFYADAEGKQRITLEEAEARRQDAINAAGGDVREARKHFSVYHPLRVYKLRKAA